MGLSGSLPVKKITADHFYHFHSGSTLRVRQGGSFHPRHKIPPETQMTVDWLSWISFASESLRCIPRKRIFFSFYLATV